MRDEDQLGPLRSACFAGGLLALGSHAGELRLADAATGATVTAADNEHTAAVNILRSWQARPRPDYWPRIKLIDSICADAFVACASHIQQITSVTMHQSARVSVPSLLKTKCMSPCVLR